MGQTRRFDTVLFDLDGTLTDPGEGITNSVAHALKRMGIDPPPKRELYKFIGPPLGEAFSEYFGFSEAQARQAVEFYREHFRDIGIFENEVIAGMPQLLARLREAGRTLAVATSKPEEFARRICDKFELSPYFSEICGSELDGRRIRKAEVIECLLARLGNPPRERTLMVGDRQHDVYGAHEAGLACLGVSFGYGSIAELTGAGADAIADTPAEAAAYILKEGTDGR